MSEISEKGKGDWFPFSNNLTLSPDGVGQTEGESHPNKLRGEILIKTQNEENTEQWQKNTKIEQRQKRKKSSSDYKS